METVTALALTYRCSTLFK